MTLKFFSFSPISILADTNHNHSSPTPTKMTPSPRSPLLSHLHQRQKLHQMPPLSSSFISPVSDVTATKHRRPPPLLRTRATTPIFNPIHHKTAPDPSSHHSFSPPVSLPWQVGHPVAGAISPLFSLADLSPLLLNSLENPNSRPLNLASETPHQICPSNHQNPWENLYATTTSVSEPTVMVKN